MKTKLIVNPMAAGGRMGRRWPQVERVLQAEQFAFEAVFTERRGHARELSRQALEAGFDLIVAVGGDGTLNEVVNGMLEDGRALDPNALLGMITSGTGGDFCRSAGLARETLAAARQLALATSARPIDVGEMTFSAEGGERQRYFANVAGMGFDAEVIEYLERGGKRGGGTVPYLSALITTISRYRNKDATVRIDGEVLQGRMNSVVICNGQYFGGGMRVGPHATLDDGRLDVVILGDFSAMEILVHTPRIYSGSHLTLAKVKECRARTVAVESLQRMLIEADGELIGQGPATFRVLPAALQLRV